MYGWQVKLCYTLLTSVYLNALETSSSHNKGLYKQGFLFSDRESSLYTVARPSVVCNVRTPYSAGRNFSQSFYAVWYLGHPLTSAENFTEIVTGEPLRRGS